MSKYNPAEFARFIDSLGLPNFTSRDFEPLWKRVKKGVRNSPPPQELWPNIVPTLVVAQAIRDKLGKIYVTSAYRSPDYNRACGGERQSYHMSFDALDLIAKESTNRKLWATAMGMRGKKFRNPLTGKFFTYAGGIGYYPKSNFTHIDDRGVNANW